MYAFTYRSDAGYYLRNVILSLQLYRTTVELITVDHSKLYHWRDELNISCD